MLESFFFTFAFCSKGVYFFDVQNAVCILHFVYLYNLLESTAEREKGVGGTGFGFQRADPAAGAIPTPPGLCSQQVCPRVKEVGQTPPPAALVSD